MNPSIVRLLYIMKRVPALLAIYGLLFLILGDLLQNEYIGWSSILLVAGMMLITLAICRMIIDGITQQ